MTCVVVSCYVHGVYRLVLVVVCFFFFQAEDGIRDLVRSRGLGDVYKRQVVRMVGRWAEPQVVMKTFRRCSIADGIAVAADLALSLIHILRCRRAI